MNDIMTTVNETLTTLTAHLDAAETALNEKTYQAKLTEALKPFQPGGPGEFAGSDAIKARERQTREAWEKTAAESLWPIDKLLRHVDPLVTEAIADTEEPPDPVTAWHRATGKAENSASEFINLHMLDEMRQARLTRQLQELSPQELRRLYESALRRPYDQANATTIRVFETEWKAGRINPQTGKPQDSVVLQELDRTVRTTRAARVPEVVRKLQGAVAYARSLSQDAHKRRGLPYGQAEGDSK